MALVDALQTVEGVKVVHLKETEVYAADEPSKRKIYAIYTPAAGYLRTGDISIEMIDHD